MTNLEELQRAVAAIQPQLLHVRELVHLLEAEQQPAAEEDYDVDNELPMGSGGVTVTELLEALMMLTVILPDPDQFLVQAAGPQGLSFTTFPVQKRVDDANGEEYEAAEALAHAAAEKAVEQHADPAVGVKVLASKGELQWLVEDYR